MILELLIVFSSILSITNTVTLCNIKHQKEIKKNNLQSQKQERLDTINKKFITILENTTSEEQIIDDYNQYLRNEGLQLLKTKVETKYYDKIAEQAIMYKLQDNELKKYSIFSSVSNANTDNNIINEKESEVKRIKDKLYNKQYNTL